MLFGHLYKFQSTLPREERRSRSRQGTSLLHFNPRSHERSDAEVDRINAEARRFQSTLPREERHWKASGRILEVNISIHAPTRGATYVNVEPVSTLSDFNPRSHERSDSNDKNFYSVTDIISIHAPTRGATHTK